MWARPKMLLSLALFIKGIIVVASVLFLIGVFFALVIPFAKYLIAQLSSSPAVQIETTKIGAEDVSSYLAPRAKELGRGVHLDALYEIRVPPLAENFGSGDNFKLPDDLKIEIQGVNVVVKSVLSILPDDRYKISAQSIKGMSDSVVQLDWKPPTGKPQTWLLRAEPSDGTGEAATKRMVDRMIATILYHMYYDRDGPKEWRKNPKVAAELNEVTFPNARALESFFVGQQYLNAYLRNTDNSTALTSAEAEFRRLQKEMPEFLDGLMLLGVTLSETRNEADAITVYERAKRLLQEDIKKLDEQIKKLETDAEPKLAGAINAKKAAEITAHKTLFQAQLFQANAYRKLYRWGDLARAIAELDEIDGALARIEETALPGSSDRDKLEFAEIHAAALSEKANSIGYGLILLYPETFVAELKGKLPVSIELPAELRQQIDQIQDNAQRNSAYAAVLHHLYEKQQGVLELARAKIEKITRAVAKDDSAWKRESDRLTSLLLSAEGYAMFRHAQAPDKTGKVRRDDDFTKLCSDALGKLQDADARQPDQYVVLQNLGMINGDPRFDSRNRLIGTARRYFERSIKIKPNDYFGYQNLAALVVRQAYAWGAEFIDADTIKNAIATANNSLQRRPDNGTVFVILSQIYALQWAVQTDPDQKKAAEALFAASLANAQKVKANPVRIMTSQLQWGLLRLRAAALDASGTANAGPNAAKSKEATFTSAKDSFKIELKNAIDLASKIPGWEAQQLVLVARDLLATVDSSSSDKRDKLIWPSSPIASP